ncbi:thioredoxin reductase (NADPH) [Succinivibrio dextrinosolvens DSM 3072]|uniref:Thioredoxin reductase n=1 Tax=Succinivibrio dextrinosolvens DSM 3072 TaxID=1123324 RepID=A0A1T4V885_9GAMM|nr:thioredoxin-disulfide reductase [Succinivibrio dextrinosolvens]SKA61147.1 thioredoxin reductase (NADPH) [Succinivibrio dextrinosolvens DSM 3072]
MTQEVLNTVIIGSGPAGWTAAIYACRSGLSPVLVSGPEVGGQLTTTPEIGNWPGRKDAPDGFSLMKTLQEHAVSLGTKMLSDTVTKVDFSQEIKEVTLSSGDVLKTKTVIIATGAKARYLGLPSEEIYKGKGISACATCDGFFFRNKEVAVVGGGSAAFVEALYLTNMCKKVYLIHRREGFRSEKVMVDKLRSMVDSGKVEFILNAQITEFKGDGNKLSGVELDVKGQKKELALDGVFVAIGHAPATSIFEGQLELDNGYIKTGFGSDTATSVKGVFAAGDCADMVYRQAITSAGEGCKAALDAEKYLLG